MSPSKPWKIEPPYYPIVYVRGYAMLPSEREETFHDAYYGFAATSVEKLDIAPDLNVKKEDRKYFEVDIFEGQLIRFMKLKDFSYADATNDGLEDFQENPTRSLWVSRFYDEDVAGGKLRGIKEHAQDLYKLVCREIPKRLKERKNGCKVDLGLNDKDYKVILIAHSMGGLVCRALIQNLLPAAGEDPKRWIHRLVTIGTPHKGIDLGNIPNTIEKFVVSTTNAFDTGIFQDEQMRDYLNLKDKDAHGKDVYDVHSLGPQNQPNAFPVKRCLCVVGSNYHDYSAVQHLTGDHSDGLVKQSHAYVVGGPRPAAGDYPNEQVSFWANVHRAHSGRRGIVNSYETFENIRRFLFGDICAEISLEKLEVGENPIAGFKHFYDLECSFSIRGTGVFLHRRQQDPCENAWRFQCDPDKSIDQIPQTLLLHTGFMDSKLKDPKAKYSRFCIRIAAIEHRVEKRFFSDHEYAGRAIYDETVEIYVGDVDEKHPGNKLRYAWLSDGGELANCKPDDEGTFRIKLREARMMKGELVIRPSAWPDAKLTLDKTN